MTCKGYQRTAGDIGKAGKNTVLTMVLVNPAIAFATLGNHWVGGEHHGEHHGQGDGFSNADVH